MKMREKRGFYTGRGGGGGGGGGGGEMKGIFQLMALSAYLMAGLEKKKGKLMVGAGHEGFVADKR